MLLGRALSRLAAGITRLPSVGPAFATRPSGNDPTMPARECCQPASPSRCAKLRSMTGPNLGPGSFLQLQRPA